MTIEIRDGSHSIPPYEGVTAPQVNDLKNVFFNHLGHCSISEKDLAVLLRNIKLLDQLGTAWMKELKEKIEAAKQAAART